MQPRFGASVRQNAHPFIPSYAERLPVAGFLYLTVSGQFGDPGYSYIDFRYFVPCGVIYNSGCGQAEHGLEFFYCCRSCRTVDTVGRDFRNRRVGAGDDGQLLLHLPDFAAGGTLSQIVARPRGGDAGDGFGGVDVHVVAVVVAENLDGSVALVA